MLSLYVVIKPFTILAAACVGHAHVSVAAAAYSGMVCMSCQFLQGW